MASSIGEARREQAKLMPAEYIHVRGARVHNLKGVDVRIPRGKLVVFTGPSGSGKSSLAFDTIYAEGQRRYLESLSSYARQFLQNFDKPDVDSITGLSPAIAIEQKAASHNPRSTVGTVTEVYDYLRVLYARVGTQHCYQCGQRVGRQTVDEMVERVLALGDKARLYLLAPVALGRKGEYRDVFAAARVAGYARVRVNGEILSLEEEIRLDKKRKHDIEIVIDRLVLAEDIRPRLTEGVELALKESGGTLRVLNVDDGHELLFSELNACVACGISYEELTPQMFSFNNPQGACAECDGLGTALEVDSSLVMPDPTLSVREGGVRLWGQLSNHRDYFEPYVQAFLGQFGASVDLPLREFPPEALHGLLEGGTFTWRRGTREFEGVAATIRRLYRQTQSDAARRWYAQFFSDKPCTACQGKRLRPASLAVRVGGLAIDALVAQDIDSATAWFDALPHALDATQREIAHELVKEITDRLHFLRNVGLNYLTLNRSAPTLSGGESQRIRLASQIGSGLTGVLYVLDEPSIGLHQRDNRKLIGTLESLRDLGNTVVVVEHDEETMRRADWIIDFGPRAGLHGGEIVGEGTADDLAQRSATITGEYLAGRKAIPLPSKRRPGNGARIDILGAQANNLQGIDVALPLGLFVCVTGVSGSGKSSLINETLYKATANMINRAVRPTGKFREIRGIREHVDKVIQISQRPIGRTPRSNPVTYTGVWDEVRHLFAELPESRVRAFKPGRFSFNVRGGRCEACQGDGVKKIEMHFLSDVHIQCDVCHGQRFNRETLAVEFKGKNIYDVLSMTVEEALAHFANIPKIVSGLSTLHEVGLDYIALGQSAPTLSGGESQRVKLAKELSKRSTGRTLYLFDEPTTGLHFDDIRKLLEVLNRLVDAGNTVVVIEHNLDVIKTADWVIDLGPEGGGGGGLVIAQGTPEAVAQIEASYTGLYLRDVLARRSAPSAASGSGDGTARRAAGGGAARRASAHARGAVGAALVPPAAPQLQDEITAERDRLGNDGTSPARARRKGSAGKG
jgi:excinuclease ABC subunit A